MNGQHPLSANKSRCFSVSTDVLLQASQLLLPKEERDVPTWSCSHPLLIELLSLLVMDVRKVLQLHRQKILIKKGEADPRERPDVDTTLGVYELNAMQA